MKYFEDVLFNKAVARGGCHGCMCTPLFKNKNKKNQQKTISFVE